MSNINIYKNMEVFTLISIDEVFNVMMRTLIIFFFAFVILRVLGKKQLAHLTYIDLLLVISLGSAVGDVMIYTEDISQMVSSMVAISVVGVFVKIFNESTSHSKKMSNLLVGTARLLINNGKIEKRALADEDMSEDALMSMLRVKGFESVKEVKKAFLESDGELSIVAKKKK